MTPQAETRPAGEVLQLIDEATAAATGQSFFDALTRNVAVALGVNCTFIARFTDDLTLAQVRSFWLGDRLLEPFD